MAKKSKLLTQEEIHALIKPKAEEIMKDVQDAAKTAVEEFYNDPSYHIGKFPYERTGSFNNFGNVGECEEIENGYRLVFEYKASDVTVNPWLYFNGSPKWAFDADFVHGYHGGPKRINRQWTWSNTSQLNPSPWERIKQYIDEKYF